MLIKEIESLSGMDRGNIRFYEREGLLTTKRLENGYRDYSEEDLQVLLRIKLLRSLHISLDEIKLLIKGSKDLSETLSEQIEKLETEKNNASYAQKVCRAIKEEKTTFSNLDATQYLDRIRDEEKESNSSYFSTTGDLLPSQVFYPWRRFFARMTDLFLCRIIWTAILGLVFHVNLSSRSNTGQLIDSMIAVFILLFLEPLWLHLFGSSLGKAIFGLRIEYGEDRRLTYQEGLVRTWGVVSRGLGLNIPVYNIVRLWKSYIFCREKEVQPWDEYISYTIKDTKWYRGAIFVGIYAALFFVSIIIHSAQLLPPNRGDLTASEFVENYNYYAKYNGIDFGNQYLNENGVWVEKEFDGTVYIIIGYSESPDFVFNVENGFVKDVSFEIEVKDNQDRIGAYETQMTLASYAFIGAQKEVSLFSNALRRIADHISNNKFQSYRFTEAGVEVVCDIEFSGYNGLYTDFTSEWLIPDEDARENHYRLTFTMTK